MMKITKIEVRGRGRGDEYRLTEYRGDNAAASTPEQRRVLLKIAQRQAEMWQRCVLLDDEGYVTEGGRKK